MKLIQNGYIVTTDTWGVLSLHNLCFITQTAPMHARRHEMVYESRYNSETDNIQSCKPRRAKYHTWKNVRVNIRDLYYYTANVYANSYFYKYYEGSSA